MCSGSAEQWRKGRPRPLLSAAHPMPCLLDASLSQSLEAFMIWSASSCINARKPSVLLANGRPPLREALANSQSNMIGRLSVVHLSIIPASQRGCNRSWWCFMGAHLQQDLLLSAPSFPDAQRHDDHTRAAEAPGRQRVPSEIVVPHVARARKVLKHLRSTQHTHKRQPARQS
jgi:hypothetical protein